MPTLPATTHAARFQPYFWALQGAGVDVGRMLSKAQIPSIALYEKDIIVSSVKFGSFVCETARNEGIEDIAAMGVEKDGFANLEPWVQSHFSAATTLNELVTGIANLPKYISRIEPIRSNDTIEFQRSVWGQRRIVPWVTC